MSGIARLSGERMSISSAHASNAKHVCADVVAGGPSGHVDQIFEALDVVVFEAGVRDAAQKRIGVFRRHSDEDAPGCREFTIHDALHLY